MHRFKFPVQVNQRGAIKYIDLNFHVKDEINRHQSLVKDHFLPISPKAILHDIQLTSQIHNANAMQCHVSCLCTQQGMKLHRYAQ